MDPPACSPEKPTAENQPQVNLNFRECIYRSGPPSTANTFESSHQRDSKQVKQQEKHCTDGIGKTLQSEFGWIGYKY